MTLSSKNAPSSLILRFLALTLLNACHAATDGQWAARSLSSARYLLASTSVKDQVIFAGGGGMGSSSFCTVDRYSALNDSWTQECLSVARSWLSAASVSWPTPSVAGFTLVAGGISGVSPSNRVDIFDAAKLSWSVSPVNLSTPRFAMAATSLDLLALVFFAGGRIVTSTVYATVDIFKLTSSGSISASVSSMAVPRHSLAATALPHQSIVLFGGGVTTAGSSSNVVDVYNAGTEEWTVAYLSVARAYLAATTLASHSLAFFAGGWTGTSNVGNCSKVIDIYNGVTMTWSQATLSVARHQLSAAALDLQGIVAFAGGLKAAFSSFSGEYSDDVDVFKASTYSWTTHTLTQARSFLTSATLPLRGLLYFGGGFTKQGFTGTVSHQIDVWDVRTNSLGPSSPAITLSNPARGGTKISMTVALAPASPIPINGQIVITLLGNFLSSVSLPMVSFSPSGNPARTGTVSIVGTLVTITLLSGSFLGGNSFSMSFIVTNPSVPQAFSSTINCATRNENGLIIGSSSVGTLVAVVPNLGPASPRISLSSVLASQTNVAMTVTIIPEFSIASNSRLLMTLSGQGWRLSAMSSVTFIFPDSISAALATLIEVFNDTVVSVHILQIGNSTSGQFPSNKSVSFSISGFTNPFQFPSVSSIAAAVIDASSIILGSSVSGTMPEIFAPTVISVEQDNHGSKTAVDVGVAVGVSVGGFILVALVAVWRWRKYLSQEQQDNEVEMVVDRFTVIPSADIVQDTSVAPQRGSFGEVCKCNWKGTPVAVKKIIISVTDTRKFVQEAQMMHSIQHPNCVRLFGVCEAPDHAMVMEWMGGGDLLHFLAQRPLPMIHRRLSLFRQVCAGLNSLHSHSPAPIIHADLKPANILLDSELKVAKIADFGLSKMKTDGYLDSSVAGTTIYCAPEMLLRGVPSHRSTDVFALGLILWQMLAGKLVWHNPDGSPFQPSQLIAKYNDFERPSLDELPAGIDPAVIALMQDCWAQDPVHRPTADELWRRMSALDPNNPEHNKPLELYPRNFVPMCGTLEDCLRLAVPAAVYDGLLLDMPAIDGKYRDAHTQAVVRAHNLSEVEAKCIIMFTHESQAVPDHPHPLDATRPKRDNQFYFLFNKACRERDAAAVHRFQNFSFHFISALRKLPNAALAPGQSLYRGFGQRLEEMNDLYRDNCQVWWYYTSSSSVHRDVAYGSFARRSGTLMEITGVHNAKDIQVLSMLPSEGELLILPNTDFKVKLALSCGQARLLNARYATIPDNVDLVILEAR